MTGEEVLDLWRNGNLREHVLVTAGRYTSKDKLYKYLVAKAWEMLSKSDNNKTEKYYRTLIDCVIKKEYILYKFGEKTI